MLLNGSVQCITLPKMCPYELYLAVNHIKKVKVEFLHPLNFEYWTS